LAGQSHTDSCLSLQVEVWQEKTADTRQGGQGHSELLKQKVSMFYNYRCILILILEEHLNKKRSLSYNAHSSNCMFLFVY